MGDGETVGLETGCWCEGAVIDEIGAVSHGLQDSVRLMDEVDLEADVELDLVRVVAWDGDDADEIEERDAALSIVHEVNLALFICCETFLHVGDRCLVCEWPGCTLFDDTIRGLEEAAEIPERKCYLTPVSRMEKGGPHQFLPMTSVDS